jgi:hypothetical protein
VHTIWPEVEEKAEGVDVKKIASLGGIHKIVKLCFKVEKF